MPFFDGNNENKFNINNYFDEIDGNHEDFFDSFKDDAERGVGLLKSSIVRSMALFGECYFRGFGLKRNLETASSWMEQAVDLESNDEAPSADDINNLWIFSSALEINWQEFEEYWAEYMGLQRLKRRHKMSRIRTRSDGQPVCFHFRSFANTAEWSKIRKRAKLVPLRKSLKRNFICSSRDAKADD